MNENVAVANLVNEAAASPEAPSVPAGGCQQPLLVSKIKPSQFERTRQAGGTCKWLIKSVMGLLVLVAAQKERWHEN